MFCACNQGKVNRLEPETEARRLDSIRTVHGRALLLQCSGLHVMRFQDEKKLFQLADDKNKARLPRTIAIVPLCSYFRSARHVKVAIETFNRPQSHPAAVDSVDKVC